MPKAPRSSYNLAFKLKVVAEAEAVVNNSEITGDQCSLLAKRSSEPLQWWAKNVGKTKSDGLLLAKSILNWITILDWFSEQRSQGKSLVFFKTMKCFEQLISVRSCCNVYTSRGNDRFWLARFLCCEKRSNNYWSKSCSFIFYRICCWRINSATKSNGVMQWRGLKVSLGWEDRSKHVGSNALDGSENDAIYDD